MPSRRHLVTMLRAGPLLAVVGSLAAVVAVWAAAVPRPPQVFRRVEPSFTNDVRALEDHRLAPGSELNAAPFTGPRRPATLFDTVLGWLVVGVVAAGVLFVLYLGIRAWLRSREDRSIVPDDASAPEPDRLVAAVTTDAEGRFVALAGGTPREGIVAAWLRLESSLRSAGLVLPASRTSTETTVDTLGRFVVDADALHDLAALYRESGWSRHEMTEDHRSRAEAALRSLDAQLAQVARGDDHRDVRRGLRPAARSGAGRG